jgi:hypothetical protein
MLDYGVLVAGVLKLGTMTLHPDPWPDPSRSRHSANTVIPRLIRT